MIDFTHEDIERLWNSIVHYIPERQKLDCAIDFIKSLEDIGVELDEIKASAEYDPKLDYSSSVCSQVLQDLQTFPSHVFQLVAILEYTLLQ